MAPELEAPRATTALRPCTLGARRGSEYVEGDTHDPEIRLRDLILDDERTMIWPARVAFGGLIRALAALGGAITAYGATGMFTSSGLMPPNVIVYLGLVVCACAAIMLWSTERRISGLWPTLLTFGLPYSLYAVPLFGVQECAAPYQPITAVYRCAVVGSHALAVVAPLITMLAIVLALLDILAIARSWRTVARP